MFYVAKHEAAVLAQIALHKNQRGQGNGDGNFEIGIFADAGHRALATGISRQFLPALYKDPSTSELIYMLSVR